MLVEMTILNLLVEIKIMENFHAGENWFRRMSENWRKGMHSREK